MFGRVFGLESKIAAKISTNDAELAYKNGTPAWLQEPGRTILQDMSLDDPWVVVVSKVQFTSTS